MIYNTYTNLAAQIISRAANILRGGNPSYTSADFLAAYPQFGIPSGGTEPNVPTAILDVYVAMALAAIQKNRWHSAWEVAVGYFIAHFCTIYLRTLADAEDGKSAIAQAGNGTGIVSSESVDGVSYSLDISTLTNDLSGVGGWKTTEFGIQLATLAKMYGKGGMSVI